MAFTDKDRTMLTDVYNAIFGKPNDRHDLGVIGDVKMNTEFRKSVSKRNWITFVAFLAMIGAVIAQNLEVF